MLGVSKVTGKLELEPGYQETKDLVPVAKKLKTGDSSSGSSFWHPIKTWKPEPGAYIF
jgi:hypothetical protein